MLSFCLRKPLPGVGESIQEPVFDKRVASELNQLVMGISCHGMPLAATKVHVNLCRNRQYFDTDREV